MASHDAVTLPAARSFRRNTVALLFATLLIPILVWRFSPAALRQPKGSSLLLAIPLPELPDLPDFVQNRWFFATGIMALFLWLIAATGVGSYFFHSGRLTPARQRRAIALAYYASAPLAMITPLFILAAALLWLMDQYGYVNFGFQIVGSLYIVSLILAALAPIACWMATLRLLSAATASWRRTLIAGVLLWPIWVLLGVVAFVGLTFIVNYSALFLRAP